MSNAVDQTSEPNKNHHFNSQNPTQTPFNEPHKIYGNLIAIQPRNKSLNLVSKIN